MSRKKELSIKRRQAAEDVALFIAAVARERTNALLEQLSPSVRESALIEARVVDALDSAARHARLTRAFGDHPAAADQVRAMAMEASPTMKVALRRALPSYYRALVEPGATPDGSSNEPDSGVAQMAERLIHESLR